MSSKRALTALFARTTPKVTPTAAVAAASPARSLLSTSYAQSLVKPNRAYSTTNTATTRCRTPLSALSAQCLFQSRTALGPQRRRWVSYDESAPAEKAQKVRQVMFEDINAAISNPSPSHPTILIDVREPPELASGIIPTAVSLPISQADGLFLSPEDFLTRFGFEKPRMDAASRSETTPDEAGAADAEADSEAGATGGGDGEPDIIFYCKAGVRARGAAEFAIMAGYEPERIAVYDGSWLDWEKNGGKKEKWEGPEE
ncbi:hypothetical protein AJ80_04488 [Polytolypa hystricis UAMH7299]|uniref:Rhodanese domain-containing protein n=1 Tax=Polytolypa hystricis (strain UAMH7299) TaxID=1447883 RepID=A0A2B7YAU6_POLH7|nr:hypothetical protein AJ80_04488 [Polytolypa hystricis UAMH7299]